MVDSLSRIRYSRDPAMNITRDQLHQIALRLFGEHHRLHKLYKAAASIAERERLSPLVEAAARAAWAAFEEYNAWPESA